MFEKMSTVELLQGANNCPDKVFFDPGLAVGGWKRAKLFPAHSDRRVLRLRKGGQRLTTKGGKR